MNKHNHTSWSKINNYIYIGTNQCCQTHFSKELLEKGIEADISLEKKRVDAPFGVNYYLWLPVEDHRPPTKDQFRLGVSMLDYLVKAKKKIYVHCQNGHGRAPTLVVAYLIKKGMSVKEAISFLKSKRPGIHFHTSQVSALRKLEKYYE